MEKNDNLVFESVNNDNLPETTEESSPLDYIDNHLADYFTNEELLLLRDNTSDSDDIPVDIYLVKANKDRNCNILLTCGMSTVAMEMPDEEETESEYLELAMLLPANWKYSPEDLKEENNYWPIRLLKNFAKFPHANQTWLGVNHCLTNTELAMPTAGNNKFTGAILLPSITLPEDFTQIKMETGSIYILSLFPLYQEEIDFNIKFGSDDFFDKLDKYEIDEIIDINRKNTCK